MCNRIVSLIRGDGSTVTEQKDFEDVATAFLLRALLKAGGAAPRGDPQLCSCESDRTHECRTD